MGLSSRSYAPRGFSYDAIPPGVKWLVIVNAAVWLAYVAADLTGAGALFRWMALVPRQVLGGRIWEVVTYLFLHSASDVGHVLINMLMLWMFGANLERSWGTRYFLRYYFLCGVGAALCVITVSYLFTGNTGGATLGASGAIFGLLLAFGVVFAESTILFMFMFPMKAKYAVAIFGAIEFFYTIRSSGDGVSHIAHLGGMLFGLIYLRARSTRRPVRATASTSSIGQRLRGAYKQWKIQRAKKQFEVYLRKHRDE